MATYYWRGRTTGGLAQFDRSVIPAALLDVNGNPQSAFFQGEWYVVANADGSVMNPQAMGVPAGEPDIYSSYVNFGTWDSITPTALQPTRVQSFGNATTGPVVTANGNVTVGNLLVAFSTAYSGFPVITDSLGLTWTRVVGGYGNSTWTAPVTASGLCTVTGTQTLNTQGIALRVVEVNSANTLNPVDVVARASGFSALATVTTLVPTYSNDLALGWVYSAVGAPSGRTFSPSLLAQTDEAIQNGGNIWMGVSDGTIAAASPETFSATVPAGGWGIECLMIQGGI